MPKKYNVIAIDLPGHGDTARVATDIGILNFVEAVNEVIIVCLSTNNLKSLDLQFTFLETILERKVFLIKFRENLQR